MLLASHSDRQPSPANLKPVHALRASPGPIASEFLQKFGAQARLYGAEMRLYGNATADPGFLEKRCHASPLQSVPAPQAARTCACAIVQSLAAFGGGMPNRYSARIRLIHSNGTTTSAKKVDLL